MDPRNIQAFVTASSLIMEHKLATRLKAMDVLQYLVHFGHLTPMEGNYIASGATDKIKTDRLLAKIKERGAHGYWALRGAMELCGPKYSDLVEAIDVSMPPQSPGQSWGY